MEQDKIITELNKELEKDSEFQSGRILGSMCTETHPLAKKIAKKYLDRNLGDPGLHPGTKKIENDLLDMLNDLLKNKNGYGSITSGGSEANLLALRAMRNLSGKDNPEVILPESSHVSLIKSAKVLGIKPVFAELDNNHKTDIEDVKSKINSSTIGLVGIVGTTTLGKIDPIEKLSEIALDNNLYLHVDSALGGLVVPFMDIDIEFDFNLPGVSSLTVDPHKMGMAPIPTGSVLFRDKEAMESISIEIPYLAGGETDQPTITGTRPGNSVLGAWAIFKHLGKEGFQDIVDRSIRNTEWLASQVVDHLVTEPETNVLGIKANKPDGWKVSEYKGFIRVVVMPHVRKKHLKEFLNDLQDQEVLK